MGVCKLTSYIFYNYKKCFKKDLINYIKLIDGNCYLYKIYDIVKHSNNVDLYIEDAIIFFENIIKDNLYNIIIFDYIAPIPKQIIQKERRILLTNDINDISVLFFPNSDILIKLQTILIKKFSDSFCIFYNNILGEGEHTIINIIKDLNNNKLFKTVKNYNILVESIDSDMFILLQIYESININNKYNIFLKNLYYDFIIDINSLNNSLFKKFNCNGSLLFLLISLIIGNDYLNGLNDIFDFNILSICKIVKNLNVINLKCNKNDFYTLIYLFLDNINNNYNSILKHKSCKCDINYINECLKNVDWFINYYFTNNFLYHTKYIKTILCFKCLYENINTKHIYDDNDDNIKTYNDYSNVEYKHIYNIFNVNIINKYFTFFLKTINN